MKLDVAGVASLLVLTAAAAVAGAVTFDATNTASDTPGGQRFDQIVGLDYAEQVLSDASAFVWNIFNQPNPADRRPVDAVTLVVEDIGGVALHQRQRHPPQRPVRRRLLRRRQDRGDRGVVPRGGARVAMGAARLRGAPGDLRGHRRLRAAQGGARAGALGAAGAGRPVGSGLRRHGEVPRLLRLARAGLRGAAERQAQRRVQRGLFRADSGQERE
ncbi:unnamed protein product [Urochloa humidicola]